MKGVGLVSIILLNYNGKQFNKDCINSILSQSYTDFEIIFVDNHSTDGSLEEIEDTFSEEIKLGKIKLVKNKENLRFAGGNNSGSLAVSKDSNYIWLLNNDTVINSDCLEQLMKGLNIDDKLGAVSSIILDKGRDTEVIEMTKKGMVRIMNAFGGQIREKAIINNNLYYTNFLSGCSFLYRRSIIEIPFFDFYKIYAEDVQLSREIILKGYKLGICKDSIVHHFGSATMNKMPYTQCYLSVRNLMLNYYAFLKKSSRMKLFIPCIVFHLLYLIMNRKNFITLIKAYRNSIFWIERNNDYIKIVRERINNGREISEAEFLSTMSSKLVIDNNLHPNCFKMRILRAINFFNRVYYKIFNII